MTRNLCFICGQKVLKTDTLHEFEKQGRTLVVHEECIELFGEFVDFVNRTKRLTQRPVSHGITPDLSNLPSIQKDKDTESTAIEKLLQWASKHHPKKGLLPKEIDNLFSDQIEGVYQMLQLVWANFWNKAKSNESEKGRHLGTSLSRIGK